MKTFKKTFIAGFTSATMVVAMMVPAYADDINATQEQTEEYTYDNPTEPMEVDDNIITASAHRAASPLLGIMGLNATSGFGMINGGAPEDLATAKSSAAMGVWGSDLNDSPDPYYWNYFYNFYAAENGLPVSEDALINANVAASPAAADTNLVEEYGNVSYSLSTRPDILIGCASSGGADDVAGYDEQLETIHGFTSDSPYYQEGDETYDPELVSYQMTYIKQMIETVKRVADACDEVSEATGKTTRYEEPQVIANDYETYVYGIISYIQEQLAKDKKDQKTVAVVTQILDSENNVVTEIDESKAGTYKYAIADGLSTSATSLVRAYEYSMGVATDLLDSAKYEDVEVEVEAEGQGGGQGKGGQGQGSGQGQSKGGQGSGSGQGQGSGSGQGQSAAASTTTETYHVVDLDTLLSADVIITINNNNISAETLNSSFGDEKYDGVEITNTPSALYGVTMNSVENAMGYAYIIGCMYSEYVNPIELCAYFYQHFYHISDMDNIEKVVKTNFAQATLPGKLGNTLPSTYSADDIEKILVEGAQYYSENKKSFTGEAYKLIGISDWDPDYELEDSILEGAEVSTSTDKSSTSTSKDKSTTSKDKSSTSTSKDKATSTTSTKKAS